MQATRHVTLNFHGLGSPPGHVDSAEARFWLPVDFFREVLEMIRGLSQVRLTFDDGNSSDFHLALPELTKRGLTAEFFILAGYLEDPNHLDATQIKEMQGQGMSFGSHGMAHRAWPGCDDATLSEEILQARRRIEVVTERGVDHAACPFGAYDRRSLRALRRAGFHKVYTSDRGVALADEWLQRRNSLRVTDTLADVEALLDAPARGFRTWPIRIRTLIKSLL